VGLKWARAGSQDLESVQRYVGRDNPDAAIEMVLEIIRRVEVLAEHPGIGRPRAPLCNDILPATRVDAYFVQHQRGNGREGRAVSGKRVSWRLIVLRPTADARSPACRPPPAFDVVQLSSGNPVSAQAAAGSARACAPARCAARGPCGSAPWLPRGGRCWHGAVAAGLVNLTSAVNAHFLDVKISQQPADVRFQQPVDVLLNAWIIGVKVHV